MKEYLSLPQHDVRNTSQNKEPEVNCVKENTVSVDCALETEDISTIQPESDIGANECSTDKTELEKNCTSENSSTVQQFKNIVAIVDPPRVGLHPTVSESKVILCGDVIVLVNFPSETSLC